MPTKNGPKIAFSIGETGVSWSENCIFCRGGGGVPSSWSESCIFSYNEITTHLLVFFMHNNSNEYNHFPDSFYSFSFGNDILQPFSIGQTNPVHTAL